jgi:protein-tyrosine phosphatase
MIAVDGTTRLVRLRGTFNLRDTGGHPAARGTMRWGKLYRSDALHRLDDADRRELAARRIGLIVDLRDASERDGSPDALHDLRADVLHVPVLGAAPATFLADDTGLDAFYDHIVTERGHAVVAALRAVAHSGPTPVIVHCTSGKDRTGLIIALALAIAGVRRAAVVADYAATERHLPTAALDEIVARWRTPGRPTTNLDALVRTSPPATMERVLDRIAVSHGSVAGYARAHGLTDEDQALLTDALIRPVRSAAPSPHRRGSGTREPRQRPDRGSTR